MTTYYEVTIASAQTEIVLSVWTAGQTEANASAKASIVFMPATMVHPLFYEPLLKGFAQKGFNVVGVHPVFHGKSPRLKKRFTLDDLIANGMDAITYAIEQFALPVIVFGSSQGGVVALAIAAKDNRIAAVFPHNVLLSELPESLGISIYPQFLQPFYKQVQGLIRFAAKCFPDLTLPLGFYLDRNRISKTPDVWQMFEADPLCLRKYPLCFLASLFTNHYPGITNGDIRCPVHVIADTGDELFLWDYTKLVFDKIRAPHKEIITFDFNDHMLMVHHPEAVVEKLVEYMQLS